jgi:hypothetical protein
MDERTEAGWIPKGDNTAIELLLRAPTNGESSLWRFFPEAVVSETR